MTATLRGSDVQMPVYTGGVWLWQKLVGNSEYALRAINIPFLVLAVLALRRVTFWPLVCLTSPFVLYYVGELRPYCMQIAGGACAAAALCTLAKDRDKPFAGLHGALASAWFLSCSSLTAVIWAAGLLLGVTILRPEWLSKKGFWLRCTFWLPGFAALGGFYAFTLLQGYRATSSGGGGWLSVMFGLYEMAGFLGLGPSRSELRQAGGAALISCLPWMIPTALCTGLAWLAGLQVWLRTTPKRTVVAGIAAFIIPVAVLAIVGWIADFRVLGRHLSPGIPAVLLPLALCLSETPRRRKILICGIGAIATSLLSAICLRLLPKHSRDDCREATRIAIEALKKGEQVLWQADMSTPRYYAYRQGGFPYVNAIQTLESDPPTSYMFTDWIILNRPEIGYKGQDHRQRLEREGFKQVTSPTGFEIWKNRLSP